MRKTESFAPAPPSHSAHLSKGKFLLGLSIDRFGSSVVRLSSKRLFPSFPKLVFRSGPFAPRSPLVSSLLWACPTLVKDQTQVIYLVASAVIALRVSLCFSADLFTRAAPSHIEKSGDCSYPLLGRRFQASSFSGRRATLVRNEAVSGSLALRLACSP